MWLSHEATEVWVCVGQIVALCHLHLVRGCGSFSDSKVNFLAFHVDYFLNTAAVISLARRLAFSVHADTLETIGTRCHSPPFSVTMQQRPKTPKHSGKPGRSGPHSTLFKGLIAGIGCAPTDCTQRWTREQNKVTERWRQQFKLRCFPPPHPELKDGFLEQCLHGCIAWLKLLALHQTHGTHLPLRVAVMVPQAPGPHQEEMKGEEEKAKCWLLRNASGRKEAVDCTWWDDHLSCGAHLLNKFQCFIPTK